MPDNICLIIKGVWIIFNDVTVVILTTEQKTFNWAFLLGTQIWLPSLLFLPQQKKQGATSTFKSTHTASKWHFRLNPTTQPWKHHNYERFDSERTTVLTHLPVPTQNVNLTSCMAMWIWTSPYQAWIQSIALGIKWIGQTIRFCWAIKRH